MGNESKFILAFCKNLGQKLLLRLKDNLLNIEIDGPLKCTKSG